MICKYIAQGAIRVGDFKLMFAPKFNKDGWYILHLLSTLISSKEYSFWAEFIHQYKEI